jgi:signal transduction histidine kinase
VLAQSIRASMCVPLKPREDVIGALYVDNLRTARPFTEDDLELFVAFASQAAVAVENARLYRRVAEETVARVQLVMDAKLASLSTLVAGIAHELRNPLNFMTNFAELSQGIADDIASVVASEGAALPPAARADLLEMLADLQENTVRIGEHGRRANAIIEGMLEHGRRPSGARELADLNAIVVESARLACEGPLGRTFTPQVTTSYAPALAPMEIASLDMGRVFLNVIENALYAMRAKQRERGAGYTPELSITTAVRGEHAEVRIRDNGVGIPRAVVEKVFEPFFTTKPPGQGTGLGLSLSREIVMQGHQGSMRVDSQEGEGTEIVIMLPVRSRRSAP